MQPAPPTKTALEKEMARLGIREDHLEEHFIRSSGPGGQKVNKASTCVMLTHQPSGIEIKCQISRSQSLNRFYARQLLVDKLKERIAGEKSRKQQEIEKIRRQKRRRSRRAKETMLEEKKKRSEQKKNRKVKYEE